MICQPHFHTTLALSVFVPFSQLATLVALTICQRNRAQPKLFPAIGIAPPTAGSPRYQVGLRGGVTRAFAAEGPEEGAFVRPMRWFCAPSAMYAPKLLDWFCFSMFLHGRD